MATQSNEGLLSPFLQRQRLKAAAPQLQGKVLDIGCGNGALATYCAPECYFGVDLDANALSTAQHAFPKHRFAEQPPDEQFDTVAALAVIEHLSDPAAVLMTWAQRLNPDGRIVLTTPHPSLEGVHELGSKIGLFSHSAAEEHEDMLDGPAMHAVAKAANLKVSREARFLLGANQLFVLTRGT